MTWESLSGAPACRARCPKKNWDLAAADISQFKAAYTAVATTGDPQSDPYFLSVTAYVAKDPATPLDAKALSYPVRSKATDVRDLLADPLEFNGIFANGTNYDGSYVYDVIGSALLEVHVEGPSTTPTQRDTNIAFVQGHDWKKAYVDAYRAADLKGSLKDVIHNPPMLLPQVGTLLETPSGPMQAWALFGTAESAVRFPPAAEWAQLVNLQPSDAIDSLLNGQVGRVCGSPGTTWRPNQLQSLMDYLQELFNIKSPAAATDNHLFPDMLEAVSESKYNSQYTYVWDASYCMNYAWLVRKPNTPEVEGLNAGILKQMAEAK